MKLVIVVVVLFAGIFLVPCQVSAGEIINQRYEVQLEQNYPNPFTDCTTIGYSINLVVDTCVDDSFTGIEHVDLPDSVHVELIIRNILGQSVNTLVNGFQSVNQNYEVDWYGIDSSGNELKNGIYFYQLRVADMFYTKKMLLSR